MLSDRYVHSIQQISRMQVLLYTDVLSTVVLFFFDNLFLPSPLLYSLCFLFVLYCETLVAVFVRPDITALVDWA